MNAEQIRQYCLSKEDVTEELPFGPGNLVYKVNGKMFLLLSLFSTPLSMNAKCDPDKALELREQYDCVSPGYHMNKKHWNTITIENYLKPSEIKEWIDDSYALVSKRK
jgi:predicted DNA-binding protein (MmcQ/YjbR family)